MPDIIQRILRKIFGRSADILLLSPDRLSYKRVRLKAHSFQMLTSSCAQLWNNFSKMEQALSTNKYFNMIYVRSVSTQIILRVYSILKYQQAIGEKGPDALMVFKHLRSRIERIVGSEPPAKSKDLAIHISTVDHDRIDQVGNRMASLARVDSVLTGVRLPTGFIITDAGYQSFFRHNRLHDEINRLLQTWEVGSMADLHSLSSRLQMLIINARMPSLLEKTILRGYRQLEMETGYRGIKVVLRSSMGLPDRTFPLESLIRDEFNVGEELLFRAYKEVVARKYSVPAMNYRMRRGLKEEDLPVCVGFLAMINIKASGSINFSDHQSREPGHLVIRAVPGMDASISQGITSPDVWKVSLEKPEILNETISEKKSKHTFFLSEEGLNFLPIPMHQRRKPSLTSAQVLELAGLASFMKKKIGSVGKIRWALDSHDGFVILETIPLKETRYANYFEHPKGIKNASGLAQGQTVSPGRASGSAFIADKYADLLDFPEKSILVVRDTNSRWASLAPWACAIITEEQGDPLGHLACMAREFRVPAIFGAEGIIRKISTGQKVAVDGETGKVSACTEDESSFEAGSEVHPMKGTPVFRALESIVNIIGNLSRAYPLLENNIQNLNFQEIAHFSHLSATANLVDTAMADLKQHDPSVSEPGIWHVWDMMNPEPPEMLKTEELSKTSSAPLNAFIEGAEIEGRLDFQSRKEPGRLRKVMAAALRLNSIYDPLFTRPAHIMFTDKFVHICFRCASLGIMIQGTLKDYHPDNFVFMLIKTNRSGFNFNSLGLNNILRDEGFFIRNGEQYFLARKSGDDPEITRALLVFLGAFFSALSRIDIRKASDSRLEETAGQLLQKCKTNKHKT